MLLHCCRLQHRPASSHPSHPHKRAGEDRYAYGHLALRRLLEQSEAVDPVFRGGRVVVSSPSLNSVPEGFSSAMKCAPCWCWSSCAASMCARPATAGAAAAAAAASPCCSADLCPTVHPACLLHLQGQPDLRRLQGWWAAGLCCWRQLAGPHVGQPRHHPRIRPVRACSLLTCLPASGMPGLSHVAPWFHCCSGWLGGPYQTGSGTALLCNQISRHLIRYDAAAACGSQRAVSHVKQWARVRCV